MKTEVTKRKLDRWPGRKYEGLGMGGVLMKVTWSSTLLSLQCGAGRNPRAASPVSAAQAGKVR